MAQVRVLVLRAPGTNCDVETEYAFELAGASAERIHLNRVLEAPQMLDEFQILCIPGGFSYGDDLGAGRIFATQLRHALGDHLQKFRDDDRLILGICNGFQVLLNTGLLVEPDPASDRRRATLGFNTNARFEDRWVYLKMSPGRCAFIRESEIVPMPVAHAEGRFAVAEEQVLEELKSQGRVVARYVDAEGNPGSYPINPNGSIDDVAGICDRTGRVFALMPHPERNVAAWHHPQWTRLPKRQHGEGLQLFRNAVDYFA